MMNAQIYIHSELLGIDFGQSQVGERRGRNTACLQVLTWLLFTGGLPNEVPPMAKPPQWQAVGSWGKRGDGLNMPNCLGALLRLVDAGNLCGQQLSTLSRQVGWWVAHRQGTSSDRKVWKMRRMTRRTRRKAVCHALYDQKACRSLPE